MNSIKLLLGIFVCLFGTTNFASSLSPDYIRLRNDPTLGNLIVIGKIIEVNGAQLLIPERAWTDYPENILLHELIDIYDARKGWNKQGVAGEKYLYFMLNRSSIKNVLRGQHFLVWIKNARPDIEKLAKKKDFVGEINPSWQFCESDNECVQSKNQCGKPIGVNKKYQKKYLDFLKTKKIKTECSKEAQASKSGESKCGENFCS
jgi:hypothetical protein